MRPLRVQLPSIHPIHFRILIANCRFPIAVLSHERLGRRTESFKDKVANRNRQSEIGNRQFLLWVVAQLAEHRTVTAASEGSTRFDPPNTLPNSIADCRLITATRPWGCSLVGTKRCTVAAEIASSSLVSPANKSNWHSAIGNRKCYASVAKSVQGTCLLSRGL